jgi:hypothetical protein
MMGKLTESMFDSKTFSLKYQLNAFQIKLIHFNCLTLRYKDKAKEDKKKNKERETERICEPLVFYIKTIKYITNKTHTI